MVCLCGNIKCSVLYSITVEDCAELRERNSNKTAEAPLDGFVVVLYGQKFSASLQSMVFDCAENVRFEGVSARSGDVAAIEQEIHNGEFSLVFNKFFPKPVLQPCACPAICWVLKGCVLIGDIDIRGNVFARNEMEMKPTDTVVDTAESGLI